MNSTRINYISNGSKSFRLVFYTLMAALFMACSNPYQQEISLVTNLQDQVEECEDIVEELDAEKIRKMNDEYGKIMSVIKQKYIGDSSVVDQRFGRMANMYKGVKPSKGFTAGKENILLQISFTKTQLENLKDDLVNKDISDPDTVALYVQMEQSSVTEIKIVAEKLRSNYETLMGVQDTVYPYMVGIVDSLNNIK